MSRKHLIACACKLFVSLHLLAGCVCVSAESAWLTIVGSVEDSKQDVVQVDPASISGSAGTPTLNIRVNRATLRTTWDSIPYRSFTSVVSIDCAEQTGRYTEVTYYMMPLWQGKPHNSSMFAPTEWRPMRFRDIEPNPTARIVKAACMTMLR